MADRVNLSPGDKNKSEITCQRCKCLLLNPQKGTFAVIENFELPLTCPIGESKEFGTEVITDFWLVDDIYTFENITFSRTVDNKKFLACPECEFGPLGFHDIDSKQSYVSLKRVNEGSSN